MTRAWTRTLEDAKQPAEQATAGLPSGSRAEALPAGSACRAPQARQALQGTAQTAIVPMSAGANRRGQKRNLPEPTVAANSGAPPSQAETEVSEQQVKKARRMEFFTALARTKGFTSHWILVSVSFTILFPCFVQVMDSYNAELLVDVVKGVRT